MKTFYMRGSFVILSGSLSVTLDLEHIMVFISVLEAGSTFVEPQRQITLAGVAKLWIAQNSGPISFLLKKTSNSKPIVEPSELRKPIKTLNVLYDSYHPQYEHSHGDGRDDGTYTSIASSKFEATYEFFNNGLA
ncbi:Uncharacterized protein Fot_15197 [Forsythia ovata]|uniref:Uncharacterized protein n=1 Tax=Forsythia ovata TaxID=205694 RepID=A0ABD1W8I0_9LAMI